jgi:4a-hydroxytetrahydrobiopterin dehydratase
MSLLSDSELEHRMSGVPDWHAGEERSPSPSGDDAGDDAIVRDLTFANFADAITFVNRVAEAAEVANHHPDILVHGWNKVRLTLSTHSQGGLTDADFKLAAQIDRLAGH